jgi:hypothetical protein
MLLNIRDGRSKRVAIKGSTKDPFIDGNVLYFDYFIVSM